MWECGLGAGARVPDATCVTPGRGTTWQPAECLWSSVDEVRQLVSGREVGGVLGWGLGAEHEAGAGYAGEALGGVLGWGPDAACWEGAVYGAGIWGAWAGCGGGVLGPWAAVGAEYG